MPAQPKKRPFVLIVRDGWGANPHPEWNHANAVYLAKTPVDERLMKEYPHVQIKTCGEDVGLPPGIMGNSEVGHQNIGAGRIVDQELLRISKTIGDGSFFENETMRAAFARAKETGGNVHILGLCSDAGVHSVLAHLYGILELAKRRDFDGQRVFVHAFADGRDSPPTKGIEFIRQIEAKMKELGVGRVASVIGRFYAMDRDNRWERVSQAYDAMVHAKGGAADSADAAIATSYATGVNDEFILPVVIGDYAGMQDGDGLFFINFRADRAREILRAIAEPGFAEFDTGTRPHLAARLGMVEYSDAHNAYMTTCFPKRNIVNTLAEWVAKHDLRQFHLAETEKYPHVTFFLNGGKEAPETGEDRYMAASPKVATYDLQPEMSAPEVTEHFVGAIREGYDLIVTNYANPDMVGHTGDLQAAMAACEAVDQGLGQVLAALKVAGGAMIVTADHGNCETMVDPETGGPHTAHTTNPVPVMMFGGPDGASLAHGRLADLAPTLLELMGLEQPPEMTGKSLIRR